ncbi:MAG TPA: peptide chain release factor N(5)-glutamine methyltransferase [Polyangia bacterium]
MAVPAPQKDPKTDPWTVMSVLRWTTGRFEERGIGTPRLDAEILIAAALGLPRLQLYVQFDRPLSADELAAIRASVQRRQGGESVAYIVGKKEFFGLDFAVDARVLVPRPDTETLVDEALVRLRPPPRQADEEAPPTETDAAAPAPEATTPARPPLKLADIGTGSGAIIVTLGKRFPGAALFAVDPSPDALVVAQANAERHAVPVTFLQGDLAAPLAPFAPFDLITANLPYIPSGDIAALAPEVRAEPRLALDGGPDGLALVRRLVAAAPALLAPGGALALEIGAGQAEETAALCRAAGLTDVQMRRDLGAIDRVVSAIKP